VAEWPQRERETEHADGAAGLGSAAGDPAAGRPAADDHRQSRELVLLQGVDDGCPGGVELTRGGRAATARDAVRLLDEHHGEPDGLGCGRCGAQVGRSHPASGTVPEDQRAGRVRMPAYVRPRDAVGRVEVEARHRAHWMYGRFTRGSMFANGPSPGL